jgi:hypothetical protein
MQLLGITISTEHPTWLLLLRPLHLLRLVVTMLPLFLWLLRLL